MTFVIDASLALSWCFPDEATQRTEALLDRLKEAEGVVPQIWALEVANILIEAERNQRYSEAEVLLMFRLLSDLPLRVEYQSRLDTFNRVVPVAREHGLTVYDASYIELAMGLAIPLACNDQPMQTAARSIGIEIL